MTDELAKAITSLDQRLASIEQMLMVIANNTQRPESTQTYYFSAKPQELHLNVNQHGEMEVPWRTRFDSNG